MTLKILSFILVLLLRIRSDHNEDDSARMLREWVDANKNVYHNIDLVVDNNEDSKMMQFSLLSCSKFEVCHNDSNDQLYFAQLTIGLT